MKKLSLLSLAIVIFSTTFAQTAFKSGSVQLDSDLNTINTSAKLDFGSFKTSLKLSYNVSEKKIDYMYVSVKMQPADIYFAFEISKITKRPIDDIIVIYTENRNKGWGYIAKQLGIKPGSAEFHALKGSASNKANKNKGKGKGNNKNKGKGKNK